MNRINWTYPGGFPLRQDRLKFMQESLGSAIGHLGSGPRPLFNYNSEQQPVWLDGYVIYGCKITDNEDGTASIAAGAVFFQKEVFEVEPHDITLSESANKWYYFAPALTTDPLGVKEYFDGVSHPTQEVRKAVLSFTEYASGLEQLSDLENILNTYLYVPVSTSGFDRIMFMECISPAPRKLTRINGWEDADGHAMYQRDLNGAVTVSMNISLGLDAVSSAVIGVLPVGFRPPQKQRIFVNYNYGDDSRYFVSINTDGTIQFEKNLSTPVTVNTPFCFTHTFYIDLTDL